MEAASVSLAASRPRYGEGLIKALLVLAAVISLLTTTGIVYALLKETIDFFTGEINGEEGVSRDDYSPSEDDNILVQGVAGESGGLGYFGHSYYEQNKDKLNLVKVDGGGGCVEPTTETIQSGEYKPLSRPLFMYPSTKALKRPEVKAFLQYVNDNYQAIADAAQIVAMESGQAAKAKAALGG